MTETTSNKEIREIIAKLERQGWRIGPTGRGGHRMAFPPDPKDRPVTIACTPGRRGRWKQNLLADLRRSSAIL